MCGGCDWDGVWVPGADGLVRSFKLGGTIDWSTGQLDDDDPKLIEADQGNG